MKKLLSLFFSILMALSIAGCAIEPIEPTVPTAPPQKYTHIAFPDAEKALLIEHLGQEIPFLPNDDYFLEGYNTPEGYDEGFHFHATGNTAEDFLAYQANFTEYTLSDTYLDDDGNTWYSYRKDKLIIDVSYYTKGTVGHIEVYAYLESDELPPAPSVDHTYKDWTEGDKALFTQYIGALIPFLPNSEYYIEGYYDVDDYENGLCFYTVGTTEAEFEAYLALYASYTFDGTATDEDGDVWYDFIQDDVCISLAYYEVDGIGGVDVYVYSDLSSDPDQGEINANVITNDGKGLPTGTNGVYDVNFKDATYVKDVHDQGYYLDGCPTLGAPAVLVIPIGFTDGNPLTAENIDKLELAFGENGDFAQSVEKYYNISSYGQVDLNITVWDEWFVPAHESTYYADLTGNEGYTIGDQILMDEALAYLSGKTDLSLFDSDGNTIIDAVVLINNLDIGEDDFHWAYRYWNYYTDDQDNYYEYDGVSANDYIWASYYFLHESYDGNDVIYSDMSVMNTYTYIHEFGHILGADDYYDTSGAGNHPMGGCDIMDGMLGDHNAYTKFNLGWLTTSRLVVTDSSVTLTLEDFSKNGDTIILANNWDPSLGAYQEYYVVVYYTNNGLNSWDGGYFDRDGIVVYHINASLFEEEISGKTYYDVYNTNTDASDADYGTTDNLIEFVKSADDTFTYIEGNTLPTTKDDSGNALGYTFVVNSLTADSATITFTKR